MGPAEFLYLEKMLFSSYRFFPFMCICNTFFNTIVIFKREDNQLESMYSRIETLLEKFEIENRMFSGKITPDILSNDYKRAHEILMVKGRMHINL